MTSRLVFVYGTLKQGFRNAHVNGGERVPGGFETLTPYPLHLVGPARLPWLLDRPGQGHPVRGELYRVDAATLVRLDRLERLGETGWYTRIEIDVRAQDDVGRVQRALVYVGCPSRIGDAADAPVLGPSGEYTLPRERGAPVEPAS